MLAKRQATIQVTKTNFIYKLAFRSISLKTKKGFLALASLPLLDAFLCAPSAVWHTWLLLHISTPFSLPYQVYQFITSQDNRGVLLVFMVKSQNDYAWW